MTPAFMTPAFITPCYSDIQRMEKYLSAIREKVDQVFIAYQKEKWSFEFNGREVYHHRSFGDNLESLKFYLNDFWMLYHGKDDVSAEFPYQMDMGDFTSLSNLINDLMDYMEKNDSVSGKLYEICNLIQKRASSDFACHARKRLFLFIRDEADATTGE